MQNLVISHILIKECYWASESLIYPSSDSLSSWLIAKTFQGKKNFKIRIFPKNVRDFNIKPFSAYRSFNIMSFEIEYSSEICKLHFNRNGKKDETKLSSFTFI